MMFLNKITIQTLALLVWGSTALCSTSPDLPQELSTSKAARLHESAVEQRVTDPQSALVHSHFHRFPNQLMLQIFRKIPFKDKDEIINLALTCKWFHTLLQGPGSIGSFTLRSSIMGPTVHINPTSILAHQQHLNSLICNNNTLFKHLVPQQKSLKILHIIGCDISDSDISTFKPHLVDINELRLQGNRLGAAGVAALAQALPSLPKLTSLDLSRNDIGDEGAAALAQALPSLPNLASLDLGWNAIHPEGAAALAKALRSLPNLASLDLGVNKIGPEGAAALAQALPYLTKLASLDLGINKIGPEGAAALAQALPSLTKLANLNLGANGICVQGTRALVPSLKTLPNLTSLDLRCNKFGDEGAAALAQALPSLIKLSTLTLSIYRQDSDANIIKLVPAIIACKNLTTLNLLCHATSYEDNIALQPLRKARPELNIKSV